MKNILKILFCDSFITNPTRKRVEFYGKALKGGRKGLSKGLKWPMKEFKRKGNNDWYKNTLNLKLKILNNENYLICMEYNNFLK
jgi:hypothetical protein